MSDFLTFDKLHKIIQKVMGWEDYHVYEFSVDGVDLGRVDGGALDANPDLKSSKSARLFEYIDSVGQKFFYEYDFGDSWEHELVVEKILEKESSEKVPVCIGGERACPKEDCGGVFGYENFMKKLRTGKSLSRWDREVKNWWGGWDSERFDIEGVNKKLNRHGGFG